MVNLDEPESIEMAADDVVASDKVAGQHGVMVVHGEVRADGQNGRRQRRANARDELHVRRQGGVSGHVEHSVGRVEHEAHRFAAVAAVGEAAAVYGIDHLHAPKVKGPPATLIHRVPLEALSGVVGVDFPDAYDDSARVVFHHRFHVGHVVAVRVGEENVVAPNIVQADVGCQRVARDEGVEQQPLAASLYQEA